MVLRPTPPGDAEPEPVLPLPTPPGDAELLPPTLPGDAEPVLGAGPVATLSIWTIRRPYRRALDRAEQIDASR